MKQANTKKAVDVRAISREVLTRRLLRRMKSDRANASSGRSGTGK